MGAGTCPFAPPPHLAGLQEGAYDDELGSKGQQHCSKLSLHCGLRRAFLKLKVCVAMACAEELEHFTLMTWDSSSQVGFRGHANRLPQLLSERGQTFHPELPHGPQLKSSRSPGMPHLRAPKGSPHPPTHPTSVAPESLTRVVGYFNYSL